MRHIWPTVLLVCQSWAQTANLGIWDLDESCTHYGADIPINGKNTVGGIDQTQYLQELFDEVVAVAQATADSIEYVRKGRPDEALDKKGYYKWNRIAKSMASILGFWPDPKNASPSFDKYSTELLEHFQTVITTLKSTKNKPEHSYNKYLLEYDTKMQPLIVCGDNWTWMSPEEKCPLDPKVSIKNFVAAAGLKTAFAGLWHKRYRIRLAKGEKQKPIYCRSNSLLMDQGVADIHTNMIVLCDTIFTTREEQSGYLTRLRQATGIIKSGIQMEDLRFVASKTVLHELMHWYSIQKDDKYGWDFGINDQQAIDHMGQLLYTDENGKQYKLFKRLDDDELKKRKWNRDIAYGVENVWNLAKENPRRSWTGPAMATRNADSLTLFAMAMYLDKWDWSTGKAMTWPPVKSKPDMGQ